MSMNNYGDEEVTDSRDSCLNLRWLLMGWMWDVHSGLTLPVSDSLLPCSLWHTMVKLSQLNVQYLLIVLIAKSSTKLYQTVFCAARAKKVEFSSRDFKAASPLNLIPI